MTHSPSSQHPDIVILGSGSAAFAAAIKAAELGARVVMVERRTIGGTCVNRGCIPSKSLIRAAEIFHLARQQPFAGLHLEQRGLDFATLIAQKDALVEQLRQKKYIDIAADNERISILSGQARFHSPQEVAVDGQILCAQQFLIATGCTTHIPEIEGLETVDYLSSDLLTSGEAMELHTLPQSLIILGGGFIATELGQMFHRLGSKVTLLVRGPRLIRDFDAEIALRLQQILEAEGIQIHTHTRAVRVAKREGAVVVTAETDGQVQEFVGERLLLATGVVPNTKDLGLEVAGVEVDEKGFVKVNTRMQTTVPHIWAAGDVTGKPLATPVSAREGVIAAENMLDDCCAKRMEYQAIPRAIFTDPEVASVGLLVEEAKREGYAVRANCLELVHVPKAAATYETKGLVKMVIDEKTHQVLGVHLIAPRGADIIHEAALAVKFRLTVEDLIDTIHVYPTMSEAIRMAAQTFSKDVSKLSCCAE